MSQRMLDVMDVVAEAVVVDADLAACDGGRQSVGGCTQNPLGCRVTWTCARDV